MNTHNICFCGEIRKILCGYPVLCEAVFYFSYFSKKKQQQKKKLMLQVPQQGTSNEYHNIYFVEK